MRKIYIVIDKIRSIVVICIMSFIVIVGAVQIFMRYTPGINPMSWVDEIMRYLNIWLVLLAASIGVKYNAHLQMDYFLYKLVPPKVIHVVKRITQAAVIISLLLLIYYGTLRVIANVNTVIQSLPLSIALFYAAIPIGSLLILFDYLLVCIYGEHPFGKK